MSGAARAALPVLLAALAGCAPALREGRPPAAVPGSAEKTLALLRARGEAVHSFTCEGTMLLRTETEKHFIHFEAFHRRPDRLRVEMDIGGPLGLGGGRLSLAARGDSLEALLPEEERVRRGMADDPAFAFLADLGLAGVDAAYLLAPLAGDPRLFAADRLLASGVDGRTGAERLVLRRDDGNREVLLADPAEGRILERRIARPDGAVLLVCLYRGEREGEEPFPEETEGRIPAEETTLRVRYARTAVNGELPDSLFRAGAPLP